MNELKELLTRLISPRIVHKDEVCDFGFNEQFVDARPTIEKLILNERIETLSKAVLIMGQYIINNGFNKKQGNTND